LIKSKPKLQPDTGFTITNLNGNAGTETVEEGAAEAVRVALLGSDGPTGKFPHAKLGTLPS
jgi:hypothetical protein